MNLSYFRSFYLTNSLKISFSEFAKFRAFSSASTKEDEPADEAQAQLFIERQEDIVLKQTYLEKRRNKSRLYPQHRNIVHDKRPWTEDTPVPYKYVNTVRYNRRLYGRYGNASNVDPRIAWPTKEDLAYQQNYESLSCPKTIQQMVEEEKENLRVKEKEILENDARIAANFAKMNQWKEELKAKLSKKQEVASAARLKREKLIEEVRRIVGYAVDPRSPKFQEMIEQKEKEEKKARKEAKKKEREENMIARMLKMAEDDKKEKTEKKQEEQTGTEQKAEKE